MAEPADSINWVRLSSFLDLILSLQRICRQHLMRLAALTDLSPLRSVGLHRLSGDRAGQWAMTGQYFGNSAQFWMNLQTRYDFAIVEKEKGAQIKSEVVQAASAA